MTRSGALCSRARRADLAQYVPAKNIEWETFYEYANAQNTLYGHKGETYHRNFLRTMVDYHF